MTKTSSRSDGASTKQRILEVAISLFAQHGLVGTPNKRIAEQAKVDLASINYHFTNRQGLYRCALIEANDHLIEPKLMQQLDSSEQTAPEKLKQLIDHICYTNIELEKGYAQFIARELMSPSEHLLVLFNQDVQPNVQVIKNMVAELSTIPIDAPELALCLFSVVAPCLMMLTSQSTLPEPFRQIQYIDKDYLSAHMFNFCLVGLKAAGETYHQFYSQNEE